MSDQILEAERRLVTSDTLAELRPELLAGFTAFSQVMKDNRRLPARLIELVRLRIAFRNQCRPCMSMRYGSAVDDGLTEAMVCELETPEEAPDLTSAERAAVAFGDKFASNHLSITAEDRRALGEHFAPEQIAELAMLAALFTGFGRLGAVLDTGEAYPVGDRNADGSPLTPWGVDNPILMR